MISPASSAPAFAADSFSQFRTLLSAPPTADGPGAPAAQTAMAVAQSTALPSDAAEVDSITTLVAFERARVSYSQQQSQGPGNSFAYSATAVYERISMLQTRLPSASAVAPADVPPDSADMPQVAQSSHGSQVPGAARHIISNASRVMYTQLSAHVMAAATSVVAAPTPVAAPAVESAAPLQSDNTPAAAEPDAIKRLDLHDFGAMRARTFDRSRETSLVLTLRTQEGDLVELQFRQLDVMHRSRMHGTSDTGERVRAGQNAFSSDRFVNMQVSGDISEAEFAAIDAVLSSVIDVANKFFKGDVGSAAQQLDAAAFNGDQLAELSLQMASTQTRSRTRLTVSEDGSAAAQRQQGSSTALTLTRDPQQQLLDLTKVAFDERSSTALVQALIPQLTAPIGEAVDVQPEPQSEPTTV